MGRFLGRIGALAVLLTIGAAVGQGCVHPDTMLVLRKVQSPSADCMYTNDIGLPGLSEGVLDIGLRSTYTAAFLVGSQLVSTSEPNAPTAETNRVVIDGVSVRVTEVNGAEIRSFSNVAAAVIDPSGGGSIGSYQVVQATLVDTGAAKLIAKAAAAGRKTARVVAHVKVFGRTLGGLSVESNEFPFPVNVCAGCLVSFPVPLDCTKAPPTSAAGAQPAASNNAAKCTPGQDDSVGCWTCAGHEVCDPSKNEPPHIGFDLNTVAL